jgi:hypothetical protein
MSALTAAQRRTIRQAIDACPSTTIAAIAASPLGDPYALRWADVIWSDPKGANGAFLGLRKKRADGERSSREFAIDEAAIRRGLCRAIEAAVKFSGISPERAIAAHLTASTEPAMADRVIQFAIFESDTEIYYTGAGIES